MTKPKRRERLAYDRYWKKEPSLAHGSWLLVFNSDWSCYIRYDPLCRNRPYRLIKEGSQIESYCALSTAKTAVLTELVEASRDDKSSRIP